MELGKPRQRCIRINPYLEGHYYVEGVRATCKQGME